MRAIYWVLPSLLAGRPGPQESPWDLQELWAGGFGAIVSLARVDPAPILQMGFHHCHTPLNGGLAGLGMLRPRLARHMSPAVDFIAQELAAGRPVLVHCRQGRDRTGAVLAAYLVRHRGLSADQAVGEVRQANPRAMTSPGFDRLPALFGSQERPGVHGAGRER